MISYIKYCKSFILFLKKAQAKTTTIDLYNQYDNNIIGVKLSIYLVALGYYCSELDNYILDPYKDEIRDTTKSLEEIILHIIKNNYLNDELINQFNFTILDSNNDKKESFNCFIDNIKKYLDQDTIKRIDNDFNIGYNYYIATSSDSLLDNILLKKHERTEKKLSKILIEL